MRTLLLIVIIQKRTSAANRTRTCDILVNSQTLYQLSYGGTLVALLNMSKYVLNVFIREETEVSQLTYPYWN